MTEKVLQFGQKSTDMWFCDFSGIFNPFVNFPEKTIFWSFFEKVLGPKYGLFAFLTDDVFKFEIGDFDPPKIDRKITLQ